MNKEQDLDVILLGRIAIDFNPIEIYCGLEDSQTFKKYLGGSPANIAVGLARLKQRVGFIGMISDDQFGKFVLHYFEKEGIDTSHIVKARHNENLGLTFTEIKSDSDSSILMYRNEAADLKLEVSDISEHYIQRAKYLVISGTALSQSPSREATLKALYIAKKYHIVVVFDIDYRSYTWNHHDELSIYYSIIAEKSDIIIGSKEEYDLMYALEGSNLTCNEIAKKAQASGSQLVVIKEGKDGSLVYSANEIYRVKPIPVKLLKSFGGGDAYASALIYGLLMKLPLADTLLLATASASMLVSSHSCSADMPTIEQLEQFIQEKLKTMNADNIVWSL
ncbi:5-dehydro-2-deoxygluconokinase (plasmid) [Entomospira nematocerorum]|uniref:5-dehydro-2-deoxygluconokinase n=1 Tax=Entomospira nematocerorum TaxID=2719987 RepID=A0A968GDB0_9SPIO|nr:5-dehydro-2-deoxygluconokinase [Entomospira nematocera]NIZ47720.1 5-dehydro-2-deoxygluconokinase [Entomospira nematocera]WDI34647.1 5-dehydro-2-deoxygluconokinase [Entomospira nematocera]